MSSKCRVDGCQRSKDLSSNGLCSICDRASTHFSAGASPRNGAGGNMDSIDLSCIEQMAEKVISGDSVDQFELLKSMFTMVYQVAKSVKSLEKNSVQTVSNTKRIERIESTLYGDVSLDLGIVVLNLSLPPPGVSNLQYAKALIKEINAPDVNCDMDITKAIRAVSYTHLTLPTNREV